MVEKGEKLWDIEGQNTCWQVSDPPYVYKVGESDTSIRGRFEFETA